MSANATTESRRKDVLTVRQHLGLMLEKNSNEKTLLTNEVNHLAQEHWQLLTTVKVEPLLELLQALAGLANGMSSVEKQKENNKKRTASLSSIKYSTLFWALLFNK